jgi:hypothetical protein
MQLAKRLSLQRLLRQEQAALLQILDSYFRLLGRLPVSAISAILFICLALTEIIFSALTENIWLRLLDPVRALLDFRSRRLLPLALARPTVSAVRRLPVLGQRLALAHLQRWLRRCHLALLPVLVQPTQLRLFPQFLPVALQASDRQLANRGRLAHLQASVLRQQLELCPLSVSVAPLEAVWHRQLAIRNVLVMRLALARRTVSMLRLCCRLVQRLVRQPLRLRRLRKVQRLVQAH